MTEWSALAQAGLPSERRSTADGSHRPHVTLCAADTLPPEAETGLSAAVAGLDLELQLGPFTLFGPHRDRFVLVHSVVPSAGLLAVQRRVGELFSTDPTGYFAPGRWSPHVTLARRVGGAQLPALLSALADVSAVGQPARVQRCRRWDSVQRRTWLL